MDPEEKTTESGPDEQNLTTAFDIVALASSAGGLKALDALLSALPADFPLPIAVVQHLSPDYPSRIAEILERKTGLRVRQAEDGDRIEASTVHVAPPDHHLLVNGDGTLSLTHTELVHFVRPSADLLFESAAASYKERAIAVVLTGTGRDGSMGVTAIHKMGGVVIVQDPETAQFGGMPEAAIETGCVDSIRDLEEIASTLISLAKEGRQIL
jgi:two-component system chemotaxis response regulator CheB